MSDPVLIRRNRLGQTKNGNRNQELRTTRKDPHGNTCDGGISAGPTGDGADDLPSCRGDLVLALETPSLRSSNLDDQFAAVQSLELRRLGE